MLARILAVIRKVSHPQEQKKGFFFCLVKVGLRVVREIVRRAQMWWSETWTLHPDCLHPLPSMPCSKGWGDSYLARSGEESGPVPHIQGEG